MNEIKRHEQISIVIKSLSIILLLLPMVINVVTVRMSNSNLFSVDMTTIYANVKLDSALSQSAQNSLESDFASIALVHMILSLLVILLLLGSVFLTYRNRSKSSGLLTTIAGIFTFILFIRFYTLNSINGAEVANLAPNTFVVNFGLGYYLLVLVTPLLFISAFVKFVIKD